MRRNHWAASFALLGLLAAQDDAPFPVTADAAADLAKALDVWDHRKESAFADTIPYEKAALRAAALAKPDAMVAFLGHKRYGAILFAALCERPLQGEVATKIVEAFAALEPERQSESAISVAALGTDAARAELRKVAAIDAFVKAGPPHDALHAALVRAGDPAAVAELRKGLSSKDVGEVVKALLTAGNAHAVEFVGDAARLADDTRPLATPVASRWSETRTTKSADGATTTDETVPVNMKTVGEVAVEAASRMGASTLPDSVTWWYELEKGPRFGRGADAVKRVRQFAAADAKAVKAKAIGGYAAIAALKAALRPTAEEMAEWKLRSVTFDKAWTVEYTLGDAAGKATVDAAGKVTKG